MTKPTNSTRYGARKAHGAQAGPRPGAPDEPAAGGAETSADRLPGSLANPAPVAAGALTSGPVLLLVGLHQLGGLGGFLLEGLVGLALAQDGVSDGDLERLRLRVSQA